VLVSIDFNIKNKLSDKKLRDLLSHYSQHRLRNEDFEKPDMLGTAYEYLIKKLNKDNVAMLRQRRAEGGVDQNSDEGLQSLKSKHLPLPWG